MALKYTLVIAILLACTETELPDREMTYEEYYAKKEKLDSLNKYFASRNDMLWRKALKLGKEITKSPINKDYHMKKGELDSIYGCIKSLTEEWSKKTQLLEKEISPLFVEIPSKLRNEDLYNIMNMPPYLSSNKFGIKILHYFQISRENSYLLLIIVNTTLEEKNIIIGRYLEKYIKTLDSGVVGPPTEYILKDHHGYTIEPLNCTIIKYPFRREDSYYSLIVFLDRGRFYHQLYHLGFTGKPIYFLCQRVKKNFPNIFHHSANIIFRGVDVIKTISDPVVKPGEEVVLTYYWLSSSIKKSYTHIKVEVKTLPGIKIYNQNGWKIEFIKNKLILTRPIDSSHKLDSLKFSFRAPYTLLTYKLYDTKDSLVCFKFAYDQQGHWITSNQTVPIIVAPLFRTLSISLMSKKNKN